MSPAEKARERARAQYQRAAGNRAANTPEFSAALQAYWAELARIKQEES